MSNFSLSLIRKILLTDPIDFPQLTMNGLPKAEQMFFHEFVRKRGFPIIHEHGDRHNQNNDNNNIAINLEEHISQTMHRAYIDMMLNEMEQDSKKTYKPLQNNILEIHSMLRSLIPNRPDLHSYLNDEDVVNSKMDSYEEAVDFLKQVGNALCMLESEYRAETTKQWIDNLLCTKESFVNSTNSSNDDSINEAKFRIQILKPKLSGEEANNGDNSRTFLFSMTSTSFALASTSFLHYKTELCQAETADFQLGHILAPRIHKMGNEYLFQKFKEKFNLDINDVNSSNHEELESKLPNTKYWINEMIENSSYTSNELLLSDEKRGHVLLQTGWIDNVLFRSPRSVNDEDTQSTGTQLLLPEILWLDSTTIHSVRMTTKLSVVGSVLALHAASAAGVNDSIFKRYPLDSVIEESRVTLTTVMGDRNVGSQEIYEKNIGDAIVHLAKGKSTKIIVHLGQLQPTLIVCLHDYAIVFFF
jgi:hypothetical protein